MSTAAFSRPPSSLLTYQTADIVLSKKDISVSETDMMAMLLDGSSPAGLGSNILINTMQYVEPRKQIAVPNHLLETKIYSTVGQNAVFQARPAELKFSGFDVGKRRRLKLDLVNASADVQYMHIIPPQTKYFRIDYNKKLKLVPGMTLSCVVEFCPDEYRYYYDCIRIHCQGEDNLIVPIHAYPVLNTSEFPKIVDFSLVPVGESRSKILPLRSACPLDFEFRLTYAQLHPFFVIEPLAGVVPANGEVDICVTFRPTSFQTASAKIQLEISQFEMKPLVCQLLGCCAPGLAHDAALKSTEDSQVSPHCIPLNIPTSTLDPSLVSPLARSRSRKAKVSSSSARETALALELRQGLLFPANLDNPHAVSYVLSQKTGQLKMKHLQEALQSQKSGAQPMTRQMKEAQFETAVRQNVYEERQNQLRWQVKQGDDLATPEYQVKVIVDRIEDWKIYKRLRGDANPDEEFRRANNDVIMRRTRRDASSVAPAIAQFDEYSNDVWAARQVVLTMFQQAARKIIIRQRMIPRLRALQKHLRENGCALSSTGVQSRTSTPNRADSTHSSSVDHFSFNASRVSSVTFPVHVSPADHEDLAVDALGPVNAVPNVLHAEAAIPFFSLQVPQYAKLNGYNRVDVQQVSTSYVKPVSLRLLRSGPEDQTTLKSISSSSVTSNQVSNSALSIQDSSAVQQVDRTSVTVDLSPPAALLKPIKYSSLHIFNPAPGLMTMLAPLPYAENDSDFHVCPLPRFTAADGDDLLRQTTTQRQFLDRQEIIKGVMTWKKFASPTVATTANVPSLSNVWVPRWSDPFNEELLPNGVPGLKVKLDDDDEICGEENEDNAEPAIQLTMEMMKAEFATMEAAYSLEETTQEPAVIGGKKVTPNAEVKAVVPVPNSKPVEAPFPLGNKLPTTNVPTSDTGPVIRITRENELNVFLRRKQNILGRKIDSRVASIDCLTKNPSLILK